MNLTNKYLEKLLYHINADLDMSGNHRYTLRASAWPVISEIKEWLYNEELKEK